MSQAGALSGNGGGTSNIQNINVQTGTSPVVTANNTITFNGAVVAAGSNPVRTDGTAPATMALEVQTAQAIASTDATKIGLASFNSADFTVDANGFVSSTGGASGISQVVTQVFTSSGTYTPTTGMVYCVIENLGAGAGAGGAANGVNAAAGGGGGAGGYARLTADAATIGASQSVTIGAGGAGGTGNANGTSGGTTSVGALVSATGGAGGVGSASVVSGMANGGLGGVGSGGDFNSTGGSGGVGFTINLGYTTQQSSYGSGSTSYLSGGDTTGGSGSDGIVIIQEYIA